MSIGTFFDTVETDVLNIIHSTEASISKDISAGERAIGAWWKTFTPVVEKDLQDAWTQFKPEIMMAIAMVEQIGLTYVTGGATFDKLGAAVAAAGAALATKGVSLGKGVLATLIQQAVVSLGNVNMTTGG